MNNREQKFDRLHSALGVVMRKLGQQMNEDSDLTSPQFFIMNLLMKNGATTVTNLAEQMKVKPSAITIMMDRLVDYGYVERERDNRDRRIVFMKITRAGEEILAITKLKRREVLENQFQDINETEFDFFLSIVEKLGGISESGGGMSND